MKKLLAIISLLLAFNTYSQRKEGSWGVPNIGFYQDAKLAILKDDNGNSPFTLDMLIRVELPGIQKRKYYFSLIAEFEYAELKGGYYRRFGGGVGWTFNKINTNNDFWEKIELSPSLTTSIIHRFGGSHLYVFAIGGDISFKLTDNLKLSLFTQILNREDLRSEFGDSFTESITPSGYIGLKYQF